MAIRLPPHLILHTDRGIRYSSSAYQYQLDRKGLICSMSRSGNCWDNAPLESFFDPAEFD